MQHLQYGMKSVSKFTVALSSLLFKKRLKMHY